MTGRQPDKPLRLHCPACGKPIQWSEAFPWRPFCSRRCKDGDFMAWADEDHRIPGDPDYDELLSGDLPPDT